MKEVISFILNDSSYSIFFRSFSSLYGEPGYTPFNATVVGWGATYEETDDELSIVTSAKQQKLETPIVSNSECLEKYKDKGLDLKDEIL